VTTSRHVSVRLPPELRDRVADAAKGRRVSESRFIRDALEAYLRGRHDYAYILEEIRSIRGTVDRIAQDQRSHIEANATFVKTYFGHTPEITKAESKAAFENAQRRFEGYMEAVAQRLSYGKPFVELLAHRLGDPTELAGGAEEGPET
jgi:predicted DNA-binding protein